MGELCGFVERSGVGRVEQPASWHIGVRHTAGWGAVVTASGLEEADLVWAGAGQAGVYSKNGAHPRSLDS